MAGKSYKQLYEETKFMLDKYQNEVVPTLREQTQPITEEELFALKAVAYGCNINKKIFNGSFLEGATNKTIRFDDALETVYALIERKEKEKE